MLGLRFCARAFSSCGKRGPLFITVRGPLTIAASLVTEHRLQTRRFSSRGSRAQLLRGMWDLPRPGLEPVSPALAGRFSTTAPPRKPPGNSILTGLFPALEGFIAALVVLSTGGRVWRERKTHVPCRDVEGRRGEMQTLLGDRESSWRQRIWYCAARDQ